MKRTISLNHQLFGYQDQMLNISTKYGIPYEKVENENADVMVFTLREEIEDRRTLEYFQDVLCWIFDTEPSNYLYPETDNDVSIYTILFAFVDSIREEYNEKHYREALQRFHNNRDIDMIGSMPALHKLKNGNYTLTPITYKQVGYDVIAELNPDELKDKTQTQTKTRDKNKRAVYRNFDWNALYENCQLYRDFCDGEPFYDTGQFYFLARNLCGAENGKKHFLDMMNQRQDDLCSDIHWKEILTAIIKGDVPLAPCEECEYCKQCQHGENMLSTAKPHRFEVRQLKKENYVPLEEVSMGLKNAFDKSIKNQDANIHIIKAQTGAGKTETYLQYMKQSDRPLLIAVPTHELKKEIYHKAQSMGIENICVTPDLDEYPLSDNLRRNIDNLYAIGAGAYVLRYLTGLLKTMKHTDADYINISAYLDVLKRSCKYTGHVITTHARLLYMDQKILDIHEVIIDEDILRTTLNTNSVSMSDLNSVRKTGIFKGEAKCRIDYLSRNRGY